MLIPCVCPHCGCSFLMHAVHSRSGRRHCSLACSHAARRTTIPTPCQVCGKLFRLKRSRPTQYCSKPCYMAAQSLLQTERFWAKVDKTTRCWLWHGKRYPNGYGCFRVDGKEVMTHRFSYRLHNGAIPEGLFVLHNCPDGDNPACINPEHLWLGTQADNLADMARKGRSCLGEKNGSAKLTDQGVQTIFALKGHLSRKEIALIFHISNAHVSRIWNITTRKTAHRSYELCVATYTVPLVAP